MSNRSHPYGIIDAHTHIHPDGAQKMVQIMEQNGLERVVNLGTLEALEIPFEVGMSRFKRELGDRLLYFPAAVFDDTSPGFGDRMAEELERKVNLGATGLKIFKRLGLEYKDAEGDLIAVDDPRLDPLWAKAGELGVPVLIHTADPVAFFEPLDEDNERREELRTHPDWYFGGPEFPDHDTLLAQRNRVVERHPDTTFIGAHLGNYPEKLSYVDDCLERYPNFFVDTSSRIAEIGRHPAEEVRAFFVKHQDCILFGTDITIGWDVLDDRLPTNLAGFRDYYDLHWRFFETDTRQMKYPEFPVQGNWRADAIDLPEGVLRKLYRENAKRLISNA